MTCEEFNAFCQSLQATSHVVQWGGAHVWKVGGQKNGDAAQQAAGLAGAKVFAIGGWDKAHPAITFKVSHIGFEMLREQAGLRPAPYLASRGLKWIQHFAPPGLPDDELKACLAQSHRIVSLGLSKKMQQALGLNL